MNEVAPPTLVLMAGLPGAGKSTLALAISQHLGWPVLDKDTVKSALLGLGATEELSGQASYVVLLDLARDLIAKQGLSVILDTPTLYPRVLEVANKIVRDAAAELRVVLCLASRDVRLRRLAERAPMASQPGPYDSHSYRDDAGDGHERFAHLPDDTFAIDTNADLANIAEQVVAYILKGREQA